MNRAARTGLREEVSGSLYDFPAYYDLVFGSHWKPELAFLVHCFQNHASGRVRMVFEPACGTGRLMYRLARAGFRVSGLDLSQPAVAYCNERLERHGFPDRATVGDMTRFRRSRPCDAAYNMVNSFRHLMTGRQAKAHLQCVGRALRRGGVYVLGLHLTPTQGLPLEEESWSARRGRLTVKTHLRTVRRDLEKREEHCRAVVDVKSPKRRFRLLDEMRFRTYTAAQFRRLLAGVPGFDVVAVHDFTYDCSEPIEITPDTQDAVFVLKKTA